jgi:hypothetical protein
VPVHSQPFLTHIATQTLSSLPACRKSANHFLKAWQDIVDVEEILFTDDDGDGQATCDPTYFKYHPPDIHDSAMF